MPELYKIPCSKCDKSLEIGAKDAGRQLNCPGCNADILVPTMRGIKNLEPIGGFVKPNTTNAELKKPLGPKAWLFSGGLLSFVLAGAAGLSILWYANSMTRRVDVDQTINFLNKDFEEASPAVLWDAWHGMFEDGDLPEWKENEILKYNKQASYLRMFSYGFLGFSGLSLLAIASSFAIKTK